MFTINEVKLYRYTILHNSIFYVILYTRYYVVLKTKKESWEEKIT